MFCISRTRIEKIDIVRQGHAAEAEKTRAQILKDVVEVLKLMAPVLPLYNGVLRACADGVLEVGRTSRLAGGSSCAFV